MKLKAPDRLTGIARKKWFEITKEIEPSNPIQFDLLCQYCIFYARVLQADEQVEKEGIGIVNTNGITGQHPAVKTSKESTAMMLRIYEELKRDCGKQPSKAKGLAVE